MSLTEAATEQEKHIDGSLQITNCRWEKQPSAKEFLQKSSAVSKDSAPPTCSQFTDFTRHCQDCIGTARPISWVGNFVHVRAWKGEEGVPALLLCFIPAKPQEPQVKPPCKAPRAAEPKQILLLGSPSEPQWHRG